MQGKTQQQIADELGLSRRTISDYLQRDDIKEIKKTALDEMVSRIRPIMEERYAANLQRAMEHEDVEINLKGMAEGRKMLVDAQRATDGAQDGMSQVMIIINELRSAARRGDITIREVHNVRQPQDDAALRDDDD